MGLINVWQVGRSVRYPFSELNQFFNQKNTL